MTRVTNAVAAHKKRKKLYKRAKSFVGDRKNHLRLTKDAVMKALAFNYEHRKQKKADFRSLWISRLATAAKTQGISYSKLICGLNRAKCIIDRKTLSELAIYDPQAFGEVVNKAKQTLR